MRRRDMGPGWVFVPLFIIMGLVLGWCARPALAHTTAELEAWQVDWQGRAAADLDLGLMAEWRDMHDRHPCLPEVCAVADRTARVQRSGTTAALASGVERWRALVAAYWPPEHVDRMLRIMACESRGDPLAWNQTTDVRGLFQVRYPLWSAKWPGDYFDPATNVAIAYQIWLEQGYRAWACRG